MQTDTLKELLRIYSNLPTGIIVFKEEKLFFINDYLRDVLVLGELPPRQSIEIVSGVLGQEPTAKALLDFFRKRERFSYKNKTIQINHKSIAAYDIFTFCRIRADENESSAETTIQIEPPPETETPLNAEEHTALLRHFDRLRGHKVTGYTLYKGVPLIAEDTVLQPFRGTLVLKAEAKQMISAVAGGEWIFVDAEQQAYEGVVSHSDPDRQYVLFKQLRRTDTGFHQRHAIRYDIETPLYLEFDSNETKAKLPVLDLSERALRAVTDNALVIEYLEAQTTPMAARLSIDDESLSLTCSFLHEACRREGSADLVFRFEADEPAMAILRNWLNTRQLTLIKEIRGFTQSMQ